MRIERKEKEIKELGEVQNMRGAEHERCRI
jgi:hypothetical protein